MKFGMTKIAVAMALSVVAMSAQAVSVVSMTVEEVGSLWTGGTAHIGSGTGTGSAAGTSGGTFFFHGPFGGPANGVTTGTTIWGSTGAGIVNGTTQTAFGTTFDFGTQTFTPNSCSNLAPAACSAAAATSALAASVNGANSLIIDLSKFGGLYSAGPDQFRLNNDIDSFGPAYALTISNSVVDASGKFFYSLDWASNIQSSEGDVSTGSTSFNNFIADFHLEGVGTVAAIPEASTYGMMLAGLGLVGGMVARRRKM